MSSLASIVLPTVCAGAMATPADGEVGLGAIQMELRWYASAEEFATTAHTLAAQAKAGGADLVVYPEDIGLLIAFADDAQALRHTRDMKQAIGAMIAKRQQTLIAIMETYPIGPTRALLFARAEATRCRYEALFSDIARTHGLYVVAGSAPLARKGEGTGAVYNTSVTFDPSGAVIATQRKVNLIDLEMLGGLDMVCGAAEDYSVVSTPLGVLGTGVCADCFDSELIGRLVDQGLQILADPKANPKYWTADEAEANRASSQSRCQEFPIVAVQAFGVGTLAGIPFEGRSAIYAPPRLTPNGSGILAQAGTHDRQEVVVTRISLADL